MIARWLVPADGVVTPDAETARRWAVEELARPEYHQRESLLSRLLTWIGEQLSQMADAARVSSWQGAALLVGALLATVLVGLWVAGPVRRGRARAGTQGVLDHDDARSAADLRAAADRAAAAGDWALAVVERFRAVVRDLEERTVLDERPGRTAHEAVVDASARMPEVADRLAAGGRLFDDVAYGDAEVDRAADDTMRELDAVVRATRPRAPARVDRPAVPA